MLETIHRVRRAIRHGDLLERDKVALGLANMVKYKLDWGYITVSEPRDYKEPFNGNQSLKQIITYSKYRKRTSAIFPEGITDRKDHREIPPGVLERLWVFKELGGKEEEFWQLVKYSEIISGGQGAIEIPEGSEIKRVYRGDESDNPERRGLKEVRLEGDNLPDVVLNHTELYHSFVPPLVSDGRSLERVALGNYAFLDPSMIERGEKALQLQN